MTAVTSPPSTGEHPNLLVPGTRVEVWVQLERAWADGFEVADCTADGYAIKRVADGAVLTRPLPLDAVRAA